MFPRSATMGAPMSPAYVRGSLASTVASSTTTAANALVLVSALETTGKLTASGDISRNFQSDAVLIKVRKALLPWPDWVLL